MKNFLLTILFPLLFLCFGCTSNDDLLKSLLNTRMYEKPYFVCRGNLIINNDLEFVLTQYSMGTLESADKYIITGKLINGKIQFTSSNVYDGFTLQDTYEIMTNYGDNKPFIRFKKGYKDNWQGGYKISSMDFQKAEEGCREGY